MSTMQSTAPAIGLQMYSVRDAFGRDYVGTLERVAAIGFRHLEWGVPSGLPDLRRHLDRLGLRVVSFMTFVHAQTDWAQVFAACHELGSTAIGSGVAFFSTTEDVLALCDALNRAGERCRAEGLQLYYHNHIQEFQAIDGQRAFDLLLAHTDPQLVKFEFDPYWAVRGGSDPRAWLRKLGDRCDLLHLKDLPATARPVNGFDVFGADTPITMTELLQTQGAEQFADIGEGTLDILGIVQTVRDLGHARYLFVEREATDKQDEFASVATSYTNMEPLLHRA